MLAQVRTPSGATCKGVLQLEATCIEVKNMYLHRDSNLGLVFHFNKSCFLFRYFKDPGSSPGGDTCFSLQ